LEYVLYTDIINRLLYLASFTAFHSNQLQQQNINNQDYSLLILAKSLQDKLLFNSNIYNYLIQNQLLQSHQYRSMGVIYGNYAKFALNQLKNPLAEEESNLNMYIYWLEYFKLNENDEEIKPFLEKQLNPYTNKLIKHTNLNIYYKQFNSIIEQQTKTNKNKLNKKKSTNKKKNGENNKKKDQNSKSEL
jgi:hypothetical protein